MRPGTDAKVGGFQFQRHRRARERLVLEPRRDLFGLRPEYALERAEIGDVAIEGRLRRYALGLAIGADLAGIDAARKPRQAAAFLAVAPHHLDFAHPLQ